MSVTAASLPVAVAVAGMGQGPSASRRREATAAEAKDFKPATRASLAEAAMVTAKARSNIAHDAALYDSKIKAHKNWAQRLLDGGREKVFGDPDSQTKNLRETQDKLSRIEARVAHGQLSAFEGCRATKATLSDFAAERDRSTTEREANDARGRSLVGYGRMAAIGGTAFGVTLAMGGNVYGGFLAGMAMSEVLDATGETIDRRDHGATAASIPQHASVTYLAADFLRGKHISRDRLLATAADTVKDGMLSYFGASAGAGITQAARADRLTKPIHVGGGWYKAGNVTPAILKRMATKRVLASFVGPSAFGKSALGCVGVFLKASVTYITVCSGWQLAAAGVVATCIGIGKFGSTERRVTPLDPARSLEELRTLKKSPSEYLAKNYLFLDVFGRGQDSKHWEADGDLKAVNASDGSISYLRRIPIDLRNALMNPAVIASSFGNLYMENGRLYVKEEIVGNKGTLAVKAVELRPPYRMEPFRDIQFNLERAKGSKGLNFSYRWNFIFGDITDWSAAFAGEWTRNFRYKVPTATTGRIALPETVAGVTVSPTPITPGIGIRQQDTRVLDRISFSIIPLDRGGRGVQNLTDSRDELNYTRLTLFRQNVAYMDGDRSRVRMDGIPVTGDGFRVFGMNAAYIRARIHALLEVGVSSEIVRGEKSDQIIASPAFGPDGLTTPPENGNTKVASLSTYYDIGAYPMDLRVQVNADGKTVNTTGSGLFSGLFSLFTIDPAVQITTSGIFPKITDQGGPIAATRGWEAERPRKGMDTRPVQRQPNDLFPLTMPENRYLGVDGTGKEVFEIKYNLRNDFVAVGADQTIYPLPQEIARDDKGELARELTREYLKRQYEAGNMTPIDRRAVTAQPARR